MKQFVLAGALALVAGAAAAQSFGGGAVSAPPQAAKHRTVLCDECATVQSVRQEKRKGEGGAVGIVGGAVVGGLLGNQIGGGTGRTLATVGGAVAGGYAGNEAQKHVTAKQVWVTEVRMKDGSIRTFDQEPAPAWKVGAIVKVQGQKLVP